jgi:hypothetical protein
MQRAIHLRDIMVDVRMLILLRIWQLKEQKNFLKPIMQMFNLILALQPMQQHILRY